jgi:hypothetical protein
MLPVITLLVVVTISLLLTRIATVALVHTGLDREAARFQARSAFTGVGFTTNEAESVVDHPVRRRIVMWLMLVGNIGIVTAMSSLLLSFIEIGTSSRTLLSFGVLVVGLVALTLLSASSWVDRHVCRIISWALVRFAGVEARDWARLLHLREDYGVTELRLQGGDWLSGRRLSETRLVGEGVLVLGIECPGNNFIGAPTPDTELRAGDRLILYGRTPRIAELDERSFDATGDQRHVEAVEEQSAIQQAERTSAGR